MSAAWSEVERRYAIRLPDGHLYNDTAVAAERGSMLLATNEGACVAWRGADAAEKQLRKLRGYAEKLGTAEEFAKARVVEFTLTLIVAETATPADLVGSADAMGGR